MADVGGQLYSNSEREPFPGDYVDDVAARRIPAKITERDVFQVSK